jgi:CobQ-like glutamine amidotransferase family enzyme
LDGGECEKIPQDSHSSRRWPQVGRARKDREVRVVTTLVLLHLYPDDMNLYGDRGNVLALAQRARWRQLDISVVSAGPGDPVAWDRVDLAFLGGGEDRHQAWIADDLAARAGDLRHALADGLAMLAVCGGYQLLGAEYESQDGRVLPGVSWFDAATRAGRAGRHVGNVVADAALDIEPGTLVGFENHGGETVLAPGQAPLAHVRVGAGNNGRDRTEGAVRQNAVGTYLHGSLLPKNPQLADWLLGRALLRRTGTASLPPLDDTLELEAHRERVRLKVR